MRSTADLFGAAQYVFVAKVLRVHAPARPGAPSGPSADSAPTAAVGANGMADPAARSGPQGAAAEAAKAHPRTIGDFEVIERLRGSPSRLKAIRVLERGPCALELHAGTRYLLFVDARGEARRCTGSRELTRGSRADDQLLTDLRALALDHAAQTGIEQLRR